MDRERWQQIDGIFKSALERAPEERVAFVAEACAGDDGLREEVESLLAHEDAGSFLESPAFGEAARVMAGGQADALLGKSVGPYRILEKLGEGGMGVVYRATDGRLGRAIALKLLPAHLTGDAERLRRFEREARHASALNHPNILTVHDIGAEGGVHFIATEYVEGETLRERLSGGALPVADALTVAVQIAEALEAAHEAKIMHRDIKPENVMVRRRDGYVKVLDFGIAKLTERRAEADTQAATEVLATTPGVLMGTLAYMSPEQARGLPLDARTDIWSLGVVLHEMLAGQRPFDGETKGDVTASILRDEPRTLPSHVPAAVSEVVRRALTKNTEGRYQTTTEMLSELRDLRQTFGHAAASRDAGSRPSNAAGRDTVAAGGKIGTADGGAIHSTPVAEPAAPTRPLTTPPPESTERRRRLVLPLLALLAVAALAAGVYYFRKGGPRGGEAINSLAVLPFTNVGGAPDAEYFSDGITESLINSLSQLPGLKVMSRNSVFRYKGRTDDVQEVANSLGVRAVLTGRVVQRGDALSISAELVDARDNTHLWGEQYNRKLADIFAVQEEIAKGISEKLRLRLSGEERKLLSKRYTDDTEAYQLYLKGNHFWNKFTPEAERTAIDYYTQAIVKDPNYSLAYGGLVHGYQVSANNGWMRPHDAYPKAKAALAKALELDPNNVSALTASASTAMFYDWDWASAERQYKRANEVEPNYWHHHELYAYLLSALGRADEAIAEAARAQEIEPLSLIAHVSASGNLYRARQYDRAIEQARKALELDPGFPFGHQYLAYNYLQQGKYDDAIAEHKQMINLGGRTSQALGELGHAYGVSGRRAEALKLLDELKEMSARQYVSPLDFALIHAGLGDKEQAFHYLEKSFQERSTWLMWLKVDPRFDSLRSDPRLADLLRRMNLAP